MWHCYSETVKGAKTPVNQDSLKILESGDTLLAIVCDGMGGGKFGEVASEKCVELLSGYYHSTPPESLNRKWFKEHICLTNQDLHDFTILNPEYMGMATTLVAVLILKDRVLFANIGDSRLYRYDENGLQQLTEDDSVIWKLYKKNELRKDELVKHPQGYLITKVMAMERTIECSVQETELTGNTLFFLCSDGVSDFITDERIESVLDKKISLREKGKLIVSEALKEGSNDDISIILISNNP